MGRFSNLKGNQAPKTLRNMVRIYHQSLLRLIHAFAEAPDCANICPRKWDIKDGFWRIDCKDGEEWNFCYVLPQKPGIPKKLVVPTWL